ncbi:hypothetical protein IFM89_019806, partial [Coptis chinensis]
CFGWSVSLGVAAALICIFATMDYRCLLLWPGVVPLALVWSHHFLVPGFAAMDIFGACCFVGMGNKARRLAGFCVSGS